MSDGGRSTKDVGRRLMALMDVLDLSQTAFARLIDVRPSAINNYLSGTRRPDVDIAIQIQLKTGATLDWIYLGDRRGLPQRLLAALPDLSDSERAG